MQVQEALTINYICILGSRSINAKYDRPTVGNEALPVNRQLFLYVIKYIYGNYYHCFSSSYKCLHDNMPSHILLASSQYMYFMNVFLFLRSIDILRYLFSLDYLTTILLQQHLSRQLYSSFSIEFLTQRENATKLEPRKFLNGTGLRDIFPITINSVIYSNKKTADSYTENRVYNS